MANGIWNGNNPALNPAGINGGNMVGMAPVFNNTNPNFYPKYEVIQVNGENGVNAFQMGPNSSVLLLDSSAPMVWLVQTDGAGYKSKFPYDLTPHQATPPVDVNQLQQRVAQLEELINARYQSSDKSAKSKRTRNEQSSDAAN